MATPNKIKFHGATYVKVEAIYPGEIGYSKNRKQFKRTPMPEGFGSPSAKRTQTRSTKHRRCETGTHWNEKSKKCEKLSSETQAIRNMAHLSTNKAKEATRRAKEADSHKKARDAHKSAWSDNFHANGALEDDGFNELASIYRERMKLHKNLAVEHRSRSRQRRGSSK